MLSSNHLFLNYNHRSTMFQNSFLTRLTLPCLDHPKRTVSRICTDIRCESSPLFCEECLSTYKYKQKHYGHEIAVIEIGRGVQQLSTKIQCSKKTVEKIYKEVIAYKPNEGLLKWQEEKELHFNSIEKHINTLKFQIDEEMQNIVRRFGEELHNQKLRLYMELESYYKCYREKFDRFSKMTEPIVSMNDKYKFYGHHKALVMKMHTEIDQSKLRNWLGDLKRTLLLTEKAGKEPEDYAEQIKKHGQAANDTMDDLPRIRNVDYQVQFPNILSQSVREMLKSLVRLKENSKMGTVCRSISMNNIPGSSELHKWKQPQQIVI